MSKVDTLGTITVVSTSATDLNDNFDKIETAFQNTLSRDGSTPNQMEADIDLNSNDILNGGTGNFDDILVDGVSLGANLSAAAASATAAASSASAAASSATAAAASASIAADAVDTIPNVRGAWLTSTLYDVADVVTENGNTYFCTFPHTSGVFATDFGNGYWELFVSKGASGAGSGDLVAANNLSDVLDITTSRQNLLAMSSVATSVTDWNTVVQDGVYKDSGTATNAPVAAALVGMVWRTDNNNLIQIAAQTTTDNLYFRRKNASVFSSWIKIPTASNYAGTGTFIANLLADPVSGDANKVAQFDANGNIAPGFSVKDEDDMVSNSATDVPSQQSVKAYVDTIVSQSGRVLLATKTEADMAAFAPFLMFDEFDNSVYNSYEVEFENIIPEDDGAVIFATTSNDPTDFLTWSPVGGYNHTTISNAGTNSSVADVYIRMCPITGVSNNVLRAGFSGTMKLINPKNTTVPAQIFGQSVVDSPTNTVNVTNFGGRCNVPRETIGLRFQSNPIKEFRSGTIRLYGLK